MGREPAVPGGRREKRSPIETHGQRSRRQKSLNNLKQIMLAIHNYHDANNRLPADIRDKDGKAVLGWRVAILPYLMQDAVHGQFKLDEPWDSETNLKMLQQIPAVYGSASSQRARRTPTTKHSPDRVHRYIRRSCRAATPRNSEAGWRRVGTGSRARSP